MSKAETTEVSTVTENSRPLTRDEIRAAIFSGRKVKTKTIEFFGTLIEIRQPTLSDVINAREMEDRQIAVINTLIKHAYVPGTDQHVFDETDADMFKTLPFGRDLVAVNKALEELSELNFLDKNAS